MKTRQRREVMKGSVVYFAGVVLLAVSMLSGVSGQAVEGTKGGNVRGSSVKNRSAENAPAALGLPPLDVNVVNAPSVNVANTATVTVGNTPSVNVANTPSVQVLGTPSVTVTNDDSAPVVTRQTKVPEPFTVQFPPASPLTSGVFPSTTSSGAPVKTVVIEFLNASCEAPAGTTMPGVAALTLTFGNFVFYSFQPGAPLQFTTSAVFITSERTLMFADPGSFATYNVTAVNAKCAATLSGHLIPA